MKQAIIGIIVAALIIAALEFFCSETFEKMMHPGQVKSLGVWVDQAAIDKYDFGGGVEAIEAELNGDTYCTKCNKITEGKVRVCSHCGKYVK